jgi:hypothetical protein
MTAITTLDHIAALERTPKPFSASLSRGLCVCYPLHRSGIAIRPESLWCTAGYSCWVFLLVTLLVSLLRSLPEKSAARLATRLATFPVCQKMPCRITL